MFGSSIKLSNLSKNEIRLIAIKGTVNDYKSVSKNELINAINISKPTKINKNK